MKIKKYPVLAGLILGLSLTACGGNNQQVAQFKTDMDTFCDTVSTLNDEINQINPEDDNAAAIALEKLDQLEEAFNTFAEIDFPQEYDYLEPVADEAQSYMTEAVSNYHLAYANDSYNSETASYARENSARAFKRVQVIIDILQGKGTVSENAVNQ